MESCRVLSPCEFFDWRTFGSRASSDWIKPMSPETELWSIMSLVGDDLPPHSRLMVVYLFSVLLSERKRGREREREREEEGEGEREGEREREREREREGGERERGREGEKERQVTRLN